MTATPLEGLDILVAEDHYLVATELTRMLQRLGACVVGPVARLPLEPAVASRRVDIALLDVQLSNGTSFPLADEMVRRGIPVAFVTGYDDSVLPPTYRATTRLDKPIDPRKLTASVLRLCGRHEGAAA